MSKKHYIAIAARIAKQVSESDEEQKSTLRLLVWSLSSYFASDNPMFDRARFCEACGV